MLKVIEEVARLVLVGVGFILFFYVGFNAERDKNELYFVCFMGIFFSFVLGIVECGTIRDLAEKRSVIVDDRISSLENKIEGFRNHVHERHQKDRVIYVVEKKTF